MSNRYRVLAADDEYWSRENIRKLIPWEQYSIDFLEPACDGEEVLERIPADHPDIVLTDINMPFVSGLDLLRQIHDRYPEIITVAISGYDDFQKVKGVFVTGGIDYLLKPVSREQMVETITKAIGLLEERNSRRQQDIRMSSFIEDSEYSSLLNGKLYHPGSQAHVPSTAVFSEVSTILVNIHDLRSLAQQFGHDILRMSYEIKIQLRSAVREPRAVVFNYSDKANEFIIFATMEDEKHLLDAADRIADAENRLSPLTVVVHPEASSLDDIGKVYREMISTLVLRPFCRDNEILVCGHADRDNVPQEPQRFEQELTRALEKADAAEAKKLIFDRTGFGRCMEDHWSLFAVTQFTSRVCGILGKFCQTDEWDETNDEISYGIRSIDAGKVHDPIENLVDSICGQENQEPAFNGGTITEEVGRVRDYLSANYPEHITLSELADRYHVDPSYLSRIFSQTFGETITAYLTRMRVEASIALMKDSSRKLEAISFAVGYDDYNYFSRVFRKSTGVSPSEYRRRQL